MTLLYIVTMLSVLHLSVFWASHQKFENNGIKLNSKYKILLFILPYLILYMHIKSSVRYFNTDKKKSLRIIVITFTKYPILLGNLIELIRESMVECDVFGDSRMLRVKKVTQKESKKLNLLRLPLFDLEEVFNYFRQGKSYENLFIARMI